jgi:hypothetical protein
MFRAGDKYFVYGGGHKLRAFTWKEPHYRDDPFLSLYRPFTEVYHVSCS